MKETIKKNKNQWNIKVNPFCTSPWPCPLYVQSFVLCFGGWDIGWSSFNKKKKKEKKKDIGWSWFKVRCFQKNAAYCFSFETLFFNVFFKTPAFKIMGPNTDFHVFLLKCDFSACNWRAKQTLSLTTPSKQISNGFRKQTTPKV